MFSVCALGELLIDFTDSGNSAAGQKLFERNPGGAPANVLVAIQRLGLPCAFIGKVGKDMHGDYLREVLETEHVDCSGLISDPEHFTTLAFVALDENGERSFSFARKPGADICLETQDINYEVISNSQVFHVGSLSLTNEPARSATLAAIKAAQDAGCILSYDPNYRASLWESPELAAQHMRSLVPFMDFIKISAEECALVSGHAKPEQAAKSLLDAGVRVVVITLDDEGAYVGCHDGADKVPSFRVDAVDTTGAGDSFWGGFLYAFCSSGLKLDEIGIEQAYSFARFGNAVASLCVQERGAIPAMPSLEQVQNLLSHA